MGLDVVHLKLTLTPDDTDDYILADELAHTCNVPAEHYRDFITDIVVHGKKKGKGFWYNEVAEQRKGMNADFYDHFRGKGYQYWGRKEDFEFAATCVANDDHYREIWRAEDIANLQAAFRRDFVDSFVYGESLLWPSF